MSLVLLGILNQQLAGGGAQDSFDLLESTILGSSASSVTFSSLGDYSTDYQHLQIRWVAKASTGGYNSQFLFMRLNGDSGGNYARHLLYTSGSGITASETSTSTFQMTAGWMRGSGGSTAIYGSGVIDLLDPYKTKNKTMRAVSGQALSGANASALASSLWAQTSSLTSIQLFPEDGSSIQAGSRFSLYGIRSQ